MTIMLQEIEPFIRRTLGLADAVPIQLTPLSGRGSERSYSRIRRGDNGQSVLVMQYSRARRENTLYAAIAGLLEAEGVAVPRIMAHDEAGGLVLLEDLGEEDLWSHRDSPWEVRLDYYRKALDMARRLHGIPPDAPAVRHVSLMEGFGPDLYRWERNYFRENLVEAYCGIELPAAGAAALEEELQGLAERLGGAEQCLIHRDLQSQNIMIRKGEPVFIDFQGLRPGNPFYDIGSLLCDPYVTFTEDERSVLIAYCHEQTRPDMDLKAFRRCLWEASAQRLMQALGAYGFLGLKKDLTAFLAHIPAALDNLLEASTRAGTLPHLKELALRCQMQVSLQDKLFQ